MQSVLSKLTVNDVIAARRELASRSLADFACLVDIPTVPLTDLSEEDSFSTIKLDSLASHHLLLLNSLQKIENGEIPNLMVLMPPGSAKALALDTPIPTPSGWSMMGDLKVGDKVFDENGQPCNVTWVSPVWRNRPVYSLTTDCGDTIIADKDHEWLVRLCGKRQVFKIKETHELCKARAKRPMIQRAKALDCPDIDLPIDPYLLGAWLGDGHSAGMRMTSSQDDIQWMRTEIERLGYKTSDSSENTLFGVLGVRGKFVAMGLVNDHAHKTYGRKHIPDIYMRASISQRLSLLQGLIDTDGTVCKKRGCATFCNTNLELSLQVRELVRSLGVKAGWAVSRAKLYDKDCGEAYKVSFYHSNAARMPRKLSLCREQYRTPNTYIDVVPYGHADTVCIEVDSPSHLFLCGESMTPTHNSTYCDVVFVPWFMAKKPRRNVILASYASDIASKQGRRARQMIKSKSFQNLMQVELSTDNAAADQWAMSNGSEYMSGGLLSGLTGNRAALGILDDPIRGREQAESETIRKKTWDAYIDDFCSRLIPGAPQIMILTRWHQDDPAGRILPSDWDGESGVFAGRDGREWHVICLPAIADRLDDPLGRKIGETLWPEWFSLDHWKPFKSNRRTWSSLYQQKPTPEDGDYFKSEMLHTYTNLPKELIFYGASDYAVTDGGGDFTEHGVFGVDSEGRIYVVDWWRGQKTSDVWIEAQIDLMEKWKTVRWFGESGVIRKSIEPFLTKRMRERKAYYYVDWLASIKDKPTRARSIQGRMNMNMVYFPEKVDANDTDNKLYWSNEVQNQLLKFPTGTYDDAVDVLSLIGRGLDTLRNATVPAKRKPTIEVGTIEWVYANSREQKEKSKYRS